IALLRELLDAHVVGFPSAVLVGNTVPGAWSIGTALSPFRNGNTAIPCSLRSEDSVFVVDYTSSDPDELKAAIHEIPVGSLIVDKVGSDSDELLAAVKRAPIGIQDVAVSFISRFSPPNPPLTASAMVGCDAGLFAT